MQPQPSHLPDQMRLLHREAKEYDDKSATFLESAILCVLFSFIAALIVAIVIVVVEVATGRWACASSGSNFSYGIRNKISCNVLLSILSFFFSLALNTKLSALLYLCSSDRLGTSGTSGGFGVEKSMSK